MAKQKAHSSHFRALENVTTLAEAVREYGLHRPSVTYAIDAGLIAAKRIGRSVVIWKPSLEEWIFAK